MKTFFCFTLLIFFVNIFLYAQGGENTTLVGRGAAGPPYAFIVEDNIVYTASGGILLILDITNPSDPELLGQISTNGIIKDVAKSGNYVYLAEGDSGLKIIDVSNLNNPEQVGELLLPGPSKKIIANNQILYVAEGEYYDGSQWIGGGLRTVSVSDPSEPQPLGFYDSPDPPNYLTQIGQYIYIDQYIEYPKTFIVLVSNPVQPVPVGFFPHRFGNAVVSGNLLYVAAQYYEGGGLKILNVANPMYPTLLSQTVFPGGAKDITIQDNYAFVTNGEYWNGNRWVQGRIWTFDISNPNSPIEIAFHESTGHVASLSISGITLIVSEGIYSSSSSSEEGSGLRFFDVSNPAFLQPFGFYATPGWGESVKVRNNYAFVLTRFGGISVVDVQNVSNPIQVGYYNSPGSPQDVALQGNFAYLADGWRGLRIIDISDLTNPVEVGSYETEDYFTCIDVSGNYAYILFGDGIHILNISDPTNINEAGFFALQATPLALVVNGNYAYVSEGVDSHWGTTGWIKIVDISIPTNPILIGEYYAGGGIYQFVFYPTDLAFQDNILYVANSVGSLRIFNVYDPSNPTIMSNTSTSARSIEVEGNFAYVLGNGLKFFDISDPYYPQLIDNYDPNFSMTGIDVKNGRIYTSAFDYGMMILQNDITTYIEEEEVTIPEEFGLSQNYPNPFNPSTVIEFSLPEDVSNVKLTIYNTLGEKVADLVNTSLKAGEYSYQWNAQNVATGMYIYELRTEKFVSVKKMILLK
jgi:hypothetical protein